MHPGTTERFFADLTGDEFMRHSFRRPYRRQETLFRRGDPCDSLIVVVSGRVAVQCSTGRGDTVIVRMASAGEYLAAYAALGVMQHHPTDAIALEPTVVRVLRRAEFERLASRTPELVRHLATQLAFEATRLGQTLADAYWEKAEVRVRRSLVLLAEQYQAGTTAEVPLTHEHVAASSGVTRPTATTVINAARTAGVIRGSRSRILVDDVAALRAWAG